jgi:beta-glucosidase
MSLPEKIGQMCQSSFVQEQAEELFRAVRAGEVGSILNAPPALRDELQRAAVTGSRLGIPLLFGRDVVHGHRTVFPIPLGQAATFAPELVERAARVAACEAALAGVDWTFAPMVDVSRDPRWGRIAESFGEDPRLASSLGAAAVRGFQGTSLDAADSVLACPKHFAGYGAAEAGKDYNSTPLSERSLHEIYLPPFRACLDAGAVTLMTGFNDLDGTPISAHRALLRGLLKGEWAFSGFVVSDWHSIEELVAHGIADDLRDAARVAANAGVDLDMAGDAYRHHLADLVEEGVLDEALIDEAVVRLLRVKLARGLWTRPYTTSIAASELERPIALAHMALAHELACKSIVLLKNEHAALPLPRTGSVALIGPLADNSLDQNGCWALDGRAEDGLTPLRALRERLGERVQFAPGLSSARDRDQQGFAQALRLASEAAHTVVFLGEDAELSGEAHSRAFLDLPGAQLELLRELRAVAKSLVLVVLSGRPLVLESVLPLTDALLFAFQPGTATGPALADLLLGVVSPSGKLPVCFPRTVGQIPIYYAHKNSGRPPAREQRGMPVGSVLDPKDFVCRHVDVDSTPQFPFGFGLSYSEFVYSDVTLAETVLSAGECLRLSVQLTNGGRMAADEVVQVYLRDPTASVTRPVRELRHFRRVHLAGGETRRIEFELAPADLAFLGPELTPLIEPGRFDVFVGGSSDAELSASFRLLAE